MTNIAELTRCDASPLGRCIAALHIVEKNVWIGDFAAARMNPWVMPSAIMRFGSMLMTWSNRPKEKSCERLLDRLGVSIARSAASEARTEPRPPGGDSVAEASAARTEPRPPARFGHGGQRGSDGASPSPGRFGHGGQRGSDGASPPGKIRSRGPARLGRSLALPGEVRQSARLGRGLVRQRRAQRLMSCGVRARRGLMGRGAGPLSIMSGSFRFGRMCAGRIGFTRRSCRR